MSKFLRLFENQRRQAGRYLSGCLKLGKFPSLVIKGASDKWFSSRYLYNRHLKAGEINFASPERKFENLVMVL